MQTRSDGFRLFSFFPDSQAAVAALTPVAAMFVVPALYHLWFPGGET